MRNIKNDKKNTVAKTTLKNINWLEKNAQLMSDAELETFVKGE